MSSGDNLCCVVQALRTNKEGFDYAYHERLERGVGGVYAFWLSSGACLYVGESRKLSERMYQHRMQETNKRLDGYFHRFGRKVEVSYRTLPEASKSDLLRIEKKVICILKPLTNVKKC